MLELVGTATNGHGYGYTDINFDALLRTVQELQDDVVDDDAPLPMASQSANSCVTQRYRRTTHPVNTRIHIGF